MMDLMRNFRNLFFTLLFAFAFIGLPSKCLAIDCYEVYFTGLQDECTLQLLRSASQCISLEQNPPSTAAALRKRAEADIPRFAKVLQSLAYYDARIDLHINIDCQPAQIVFEVTLGDQFVFSSFEIAPVENSTFLCSSIGLDHLDVVLHAPAYPKTILHAEEMLLNRLAGYGYPLAKLADRVVTVDLAAKTVNVKIIVDAGPMAVFGKTCISGSKRVSNAFFRKKIAWREGELFNPCKVEETLKAMEASSLFSAINIYNDEEVEGEGFLPMHIEVVEGKHRSLGLGVGFSTMRSFGLVGEYENRNERRRGERFALKGAVWNNLFDGTFVYIVPDWRRRRQDLVWLLQAHHEITESYTETFQSASVIVEEQLSPQLRISKGFMFKVLKNTRSNNNGTFNLFKIPLSLKWIDVDEPMDPTIGYSINFKTVPTFELFNKPFAYDINLLNFSSYLPLTSCAETIFATRVTLGSIIGTTERDIPPSERLYAGSEETLRGYKYMTVSPLGREKKRCRKGRKEEGDIEPIGGRSMFIVNLEIRKAINECWGAVLFYDIGNVYKDVYPNLAGKQLQSIGAGARYNTPVGPLRLDIAFPLNRRSHFDNALEVYLSLGQTF